MGKLIVLGIVVQLALFGAFVGVRYEGEAGRADSSRSACERGKLDREANAKGWGTARDARQSAADIERGRAHHNDLAAAQRYREVVTSLRSRTGARLNCNKNFPKPSPWPW